MNRPSDVNDAQWDAICCKAKHLLILAGPGTGKTHTLTYRIARFASCRNPKGKILAVTFTNKAALEMKDRLKKLLGDLPSDVLVGTFHQFCLQILRRYHATAGLTSNFRVATPDEIQHLAQTVWPRYKSSEIKDILETISQYKSISFKESAPEDILRYDKVLQQNNLLDFDDLLLKTLKLFEDFSTVFKEIQESYSLIFVDEYQDINPIQHVLLKKLVGDKSRITAIGDPCQAIYKFRGSKVEFFQTFEQDFPGAKTVSLVENYRSAPNILTASGQVISKCTFKDIPPITANIYAEGHLLTHQAPTDKAEAEYVIHQIEQIVGGISMFSQDSGRVHDQPAQEKSFGDIAVLYRLNAQNRLLKEAFDRSGIPYQVSGEKTFLQYPEISNIINQLRNECLGTEARRDFVKRLRVLCDLPACQKAKQKNKNLDRQINRLVYFAQRHNDFRTFWDDLVLQRPSDMFDERVERVSLMTLHAAKGLQFPVVFIVGCEENLLPLSLEEFETNEEEERRLLYVGMTRAQERLYLISAKKRYLFGTACQNKPSSFISDIEKKLRRLSEISPSPRRKKDLAEKQMNLFGNI